MRIHIRFINSTIRFRNDFTHKFIHLALNIEFSKFNERDLMRSKTPEGGHVWNQKKKLTGIRGDQRYSSS